jgi:hypothetical protein
METAGLQVLTTSAFRDRLRKEAKKAGVSVAELVRTRCEGAPGGAGGCRACRATYFAGPLLFSWGPVSRISSPPSLSAVVRTGIAAAGESRNCRTRLTVYTGLFSISQ